MHAAAADPLQTICKGSEHGHRPERRQCNIRGTPCCVGVLRIKPLFLPISIRRTQFVYRLFVLHVWKLCAQELHEKTVGISQGKCGMFCSLL